MDRDQIRVAVFASAFIAGTERLVRPDAPLDTNRADTLYQIAEMVADSAVAAHDRAEAKKASGT